MEEQANTTGNEYGVYDMSGALREYVAAINSSPKTYAVKTRGNSMYKALESNPENKKCINVYTNDTTTGTRDFKVGRVSIIGDASEEVYNSTDPEKDRAWRRDVSYYSSINYPFVIRGGIAAGMDFQKSTQDAGIFNQGRGDRW